LFHGFQLLVSRLLYFFHKEFNGGSFVHLFFRFFVI
jgi:hypothetical protein